jgi:hypothetical protein
MGIGQNEAPFAVDDDAGPQTGALAAAFEPGIEEIFEKFFKKWIHAETREWIGTLANLIRGAYIYHSWADLAYRPYHRAFALAIQAAAGWWKNQQKKKQEQGKKGDTCFIFDS